MMASRWEVEPEQELPPIEIRSKTWFVLAFLLWTACIVGAIVGSWALMVTGFITGTIAATRA